MEVCFQNVNFTVRGKGPFVNLLLFASFADKIKP